MSFSLLARLTLAALVALAIGLKLGFTGVAEPAPFAFRQRVSTQLASNGFDANFRLPAQAQVEAIGGHAGACRLIVVNAAPQGHHEDAVRRMANPGDHMFFIFRGVRYEAQPRLLTLSDFYWTRLNRVWGRAITSDPVFGVIASKECDLAALGWLDRATLR